MQDIDDENEFLEEAGIMPKEGIDSKALLVGTYSGSQNLDLCREYLDELASLADTFGVAVVAKVPCPLRKIDASTYLHQGKVEEIGEELKKCGATLVIFDEEISPAQQRNLEKALRVPIMDRTELILEIFGQRAQTKEARLQIELAKTKYEAPRLKRMWSHFSRQRASGGYLRGEGEKQIEIDRRLLKRRVERLNEELKEVERYRKVQRTQRSRSGIPTFAIVGYTNAGKSTLLNALTDAHVFVEDKLFATLDPTTRKFILPNNQEILLTDTVGFIRKLPHTLVHAFKSTLESTIHDDVLLHLIDVSHPLAEEHAATTVKLIKELGGDERSVIHVLNKIDQCSDQKMIQKLRLTYPKTVQISALRKEGFSDLMESMIRELKEKLICIHVRIPQKEYALVSRLLREGHLLSEVYDGNDILIKADIPKESLHLFDPYREEEEE